MAPSLSRHDHRSDAAHQASVEAALATLRQAGGRVTAGRRAIVTAVLTGPDHHVTADDLAGRLSDSHPTLAVSTIYRTLEALEEHDIVERVDLGQGRAIYHPVDHVHHHLVCTRCGSVEEIADVSTTILATDLDVRNGFALSLQSLSLHGVCRDCRG